MNLPDRIDDRDAQLLQSWIINHQLNFQQCIPKVGAQLVAVPFRSLKRLRIRVPFLNQIPPFDLPVTKLRRSDTHSMKRLETVPPQLFREGISGPTSSRAALDQKGRGRSEQRPGNSDQRRNHSGHAHNVPNRPPLGLGLIAVTVPA